MILLSTFDGVGLKRNRQPNERLAISNNQHRFIMPIASETFSENKTPVKHGNTFLDRTGRKYGRLTVIEFHGKNNFSHILWKCKCDCGNTTITEGNSLGRGLTKSCGCLATEVQTRIRVTHGQSAKREYHIWSNMKNRCSNPKSNRFHIYGGKGITVCERWMRFENFYSDMGERPAGMSIERKDGNGNYEPSNCRWATSMEQANNMVTNRLLTVNGETHTMAQWSRMVGISSSSICMRLKRGWSEIEAIKTPVIK